jgi:hypothetical protein
MPGLGKKTFTAGDVLIAGDVNNYLMDQTVMNFATVAARSSAIPVPSTGMVSYVGDTGSESPTSTIPQIEAYTGAQWQTPYGATLLANVPFTAASSVTVDNIYATQYADYFISFKLTAITGTNTTLNFNHRDGASSIVTNYVARRLYQSGATVVGSTEATTSQLIAGAVTTGEVNGFNARLYITEPFISGRTGVTAESIGFLGAVAITQITSSIQTDALSLDGFIFTIGSGTMTGNLRVYGLRNS